MQIIPTRRVFLDRLLFTLLALVCWRLFAHTPVPGLKPDLLSAFFKPQRDATLEHYSIVGLGFAPYLYAWCVTEWLRGSAPATRIAQLRLVLTTGFAAIAAIVADAELVREGFVVVQPRWLGLVTIVGTQTAGALLLVWLGDLIARRGLGGGIWLMMALEYAANLPRYIRQFKEALLAPAIDGGPMHPALLVALAVALVALIVTVECAHRPIGRADDPDAAPRIRSVRLDYAYVWPVFTASVMISVLGLPLRWVLEQRWPALEEMTLSHGFQGNGSLVCVALLMIPLTIMANTRGLRRELGTTAAGPLPGELKIAGNALSAVCAIYLVILYAVPDGLYVLRLWPIELTGDGLLLLVIAYLRIREATVSVSVRGGDP